MSRWGTLEGKYVFQPTPDSSSHHQIPWPRAGIFSMGAWQLEMLNLALLSRWFVSPQWELLPFGAIGVIFVFWDPCYVFFCFNPWAFGPVGSKADQILWMWCQPVATGKFIVFMESLLLILEELLEQRAYKELWPAWATWLRHWIHSYIYVICNSLYVEIGLESDRLTSSIV